MLSLEIPFVLLGRKARYALEYHVKIFHIVESANFRNFLVWKTSRDDELLRSLNTHSVYVGNGRTFIGLAKQKIQIRAADVGEPTHLIQRKIGLVNGVH